MGTPLKRRRCRFAWFQKFSIPLMWFPSDEPFRVVDPNMVEVRHIQSIVARKAIRVDDAVGLDQALHDRHQRVRTGIGDHHRVDPSSTLQKPGNRDFPASTTTAFALAATTEVTLVHFDSPQTEEAFWVSSAISVRIR